MISYAPRLSLSDLGSRLTLAVGLAASFTLVACGDSGSDGGGSDGSYGTESSAGEYGGSDASGAGGTSGGYDSSGGPGTSGTSSAGDTGQEPPEEEPPPEEPPPEEVKCDSETPVVLYLSPDDSNSMSSPVQAREAVLAQLRAGTAYVTFDPRRQSCTILRRERAPGAHGPPR